jgi:hypothetical protein
MGSAREKWSVNLPNRLRNICLQKFPVGRMARQSFAVALHLVPPGSSARMSRRSSNAPQNKLVAEGSGRPQFCQFAKYSALGRQI